MKMTQAQRVLEALQRADGMWLSGQYFLKVMMLSQYHARIWDLQNNKEKYGYEGIIEASDFVDQWNFKSYRLVANDSKPSVKPSVDRAVDAVFTPERIEAQKKEAARLI